MPSTPQQIAPSANLYLNAIQWDGWRWSDGPSAGTNIAYYFGPANQDLSPLHEGELAGFLSLPWDEWGKAAYRNALQQWANVANLSFTEVFDYSAADLVEFVFIDPYAPFGIHEVPEHAAWYDGTAWGAYNAFEVAPSSVQPGGFNFITLVHELGHALGLSHPHDDTVFPGVEGEDDWGANNLNQGIFTTMGYNDGWPEIYEVYNDSPPSNMDWSWQSGPMAFDIAAIQYLYGPNMSFHAGDDVYSLPNTNGPGTYWSCIWDAGGTDWIVHDGVGDAVIALVAATLDNSLTGGGVPSGVDEILGGFTIANGVTIENASGGSGNDYIFGNAVGNLLYGNGGNDSIGGAFGIDLLSGGAGFDLLVGGGGKDFLYGGNDADVFRYLNTNETRKGAGRDVIADFQRLADKIDVSAIDAIKGGGNQIFKWIGKKGFHERAGELHLVKKAGYVLVEGDINGDGRADFQIQVDGVGALARGDFIL